MRRNLLIIVIIMTAMTLLPGFTATARAKAKHTFKIEGGNFVYVEANYFFIVNFWRFYFCRSVGYKLVFIEKILIKRAYAR